MQICILSGGQRKNSNSSKVSEYISKQLNKFEIETIFFDMKDNDVDIWTEDSWSPGTDEYVQWLNVSSQLRASDAFVIVSPEYSGMVPPRLKNFLMKCSGHELGNKPAMLVGVSSGIGGTYPLIELRAAAFKNSFACVLPQSVIVRKVDECFNSEEPANDNDANSRDAIIYALEHLVAYSHALQSVREQSISDYKRYPYGV